ncbi:MAG: RluA family pseudouridine synthase [Lachnospiraceae bacterium]|nr:RluA family pseudouridine synthase [Lachnospiraceae bacterium]
MRSFDPRQILFENRQILVVYKPAGTAVQSGSVGQMDLEHQLLGYLAMKSSGRSIPYLAVVHRLDQPVEGIVLFTKTKEAAAACSAQLQNGTMKKEYLAVVQPSPEKKEAPLDDYLLRERGSNSSKVVRRGTAGAKKASLSYRVLEENDRGQALLRIQLMTGRHHQIRVQLSHAGMPIVGDRKYGTAEAAAIRKEAGRTGGRGLALCAASLTFRDPETGRTETIAISPKGEAFAGFRQVTG